MSLRPKNIVIYRRKNEEMKTEPTYLNAFVSRINEKCKNISGELHIQVFETSRNTQEPMDRIDKYISGKDDEEML